MRQRDLPPRATIDYETRSACNLKTQGPWKYSQHPSTQILCMVFRLPYWTEGRVSVWHPAYPSMGAPMDVGDPEEITELLDWIEQGGLVEAHNAFFEFSIWRNIQERQYGWMPIPHAQWRCSAAKAASHALPRKLEDAAQVLHLPMQKDMVGSKVMMKMTKPRKALKAEKAAWAQAGIPLPRYLWHETRELLDRLIEYCSFDVLTEEALSEQLPDLSDDEQAMFEMDLRMNEYGFQIDREAVTVALNLIHRETVILNQELSKITGGFVKKATQRAKILQWLEAADFPLPDTRKETIDQVLTSGCELEPPVRRVLQVLRTLGRSSTAKYRAMKNWMAGDARVRGGLLYHGASTGRWSGKGVQPHNFPKGGLFTPEGQKIKDVSMDDLWTVLKRGHRPEIVSQFRNVMEALATGLRGAITASLGYQLYVADYAAIEARVLLWLANATAALDVFRSGADIYCDMAESIYKYPCSKDTTPTERGMGKIAILGLGYQMGASKFLDTCASFGIEITDEFAEQVVKAYREKYWQVVDLWKAQEKAAMLAVTSKRPVKCGYVTWKMEGQFLYCILPSGRRLAYAYPRVQIKKTPWGESLGLSFMAVDSYTRKWKRVTTYGGMIVENITQAVARDLMAYAMLRSTKTAYRVILSVHDELVAEAPDGYGDVKEFEHLMAECPPWADGCPVEAEGWRGFRYHK